MIINELTLAPNPFNHASAIASKGNLIAFYTGTAESHESQHVVIYDRLQNETIELEPYTGNPILYDVDDKTFIIYSKFEKTDLPRNMWWQHCSLWISEIRSVTTGGYQCDWRVNPIPLEIKTDHNIKWTNLGHLPRCHPIKTTDGYYLPLYRESHPSYYGLVLHSVDGLSWTYRGSIEGPIPCIQPTLWEDHGKLCALLRNFSNKFKSMALYSESIDRGYSWSEPVNSEFTNANNSILAIQYNEEPLIIWNNDPKGRSNLQIGYDMKRSIVIDNYGSYPAATVDGDQLHITYSGKINPIQIPDVRLGIKHKQLHLPSLVKRWRPSNEYKSR